MGLFKSLFGSKKSGNNNGGNPDVNDLLDALDNYINDYEKTHGQKPSSIMLDHNIHMMFADAGIYRTKRFGDVQIIPAANIEGGGVWKAI